MLHLQARPAKPVWRDGCASNRRDKSDCQVQARVRRLSSHAPYRRGPGKNRSIPFPGGLSRTNEPTAGYPRRCTSGRRQAGSQMRVPNQDTKFKPSPRVPGPRDSGQTLCGAFETCSSQKNPPCWNERVVFPPMSPARLLNRPTRQDSVPSKHPVRETTAAGCRVFVRAFKASRLDEH